MDTLEHTYSLFLTGFINCRSMALCFFHLKSFSYCMLQLQPLCNIYIRTFIIIIIHNHAIHMQLLKKTHE